MPIARLAKVLPAKRWRRLAVGDGTKGPRAFRWAAHAFPGRRADPADIAYYRTSGPDGTSLEELARVAANQWTIEEGFGRLEGDVGLDHYEVRRWEAWHRHVTLCHLADAYLEVTRAAAAIGNPSKADTHLANGKKGGASSCCR